MSAEHRVRHSVPATHPAFAGHFPGQPIVPGVLLLEAAVETARRHFAVGALSSVSMLKFLVPLLPDQGFDCVVVDADGAVHFTIEAAGHLVAMGRLHFAAERSP